MSSQCVDALCRLLQLTIEIGRAEGITDDPNYSGCVEGLCAAIATIDPDDRAPSGLVSFDWLAERGALRFELWEATWQG